MIELVRMPQNITIAEQHLYGKSTSSKFTLKYNGIEQIVYKHQTNAWWMQWDDSMSQPNSKIEEMEKFKYQRCIFLSLARNLFMTCEPGKYKI